MAFKFARTVLSLFVGLWFSIIAADLSGATQNAASKESIPFYIHKLQGPAETIASLIALPTNPPEKYNLTVYQTSVKNQNPRGSCPTFAYVGALEAAYIRTYGSHPYNVNEDGPSKYFKYGITNDCQSVCQGATPCGCEEFDLSEEYFIHIAHSTQSTRNPAMLTENYSSYCVPDLGIGKGSIMGEKRAVLEGLHLPLEKYAPYFGDMSTLYPNHTQADLDKIAFDSGLALNSGGQVVCNSSPTQQNVDGFEYNTQYIPENARKNAVYGPTEIIFLSNDYARSPALLEQIIYSDREISLGFPLDHFDCGPANKSDPSFVYSDGNYKCRYDINNSINVGGPGHQILLVGYDRTNQYFLAKNSWGNDFNYIWIPYSFISQFAKDAFFITNIRDPGIGSSQEAMWIGRWSMDHDGWHGNLRVRRLRPPTESCDTSASGMHLLQGPTGSSNARIGSYYDSDNNSREVTGFLNSDGIRRANFYIDFNHQEGPPDPLNTPVVLSGQKFELEMFTCPTDTFTFGRYAAGITWWENNRFGTLLKRPSLWDSIISAPSTFSTDKWKDNFLLHYSNCYSANFDVTSIGAKNGTGSYPVTAYFNQYYGNYASIDADATNRLFFNGFSSDLFYHTQETGIISGLGVFGQSMNKLFTPVPQSQMFLKYETTQNPIFDPDPTAAKPLSLTNNQHTTLSLHLNLLRFSGLVDIYLAIYAPAIGINDIYFIKSDLTLSPISAGLSKWAENTAGPVDQKFYGDISLSSLPEGEYTFWVLVTPAGSLNNYYLWETKLSN